jgi:polyketide biosynthesis enoyl-CoA hydratase PksI
MDKESDMTTSVHIAPVESGIYRIHMDEPTEQNRLTDAVVDGLMEAFQTAAAAPDLRVLLLTGREDVFCAGGTRDMLEKVSSGEGVVKDLLLPAQVIGFPAPVIGALEGHAVGGGLLLALGCDILVAAEESRYGANFTSMGFTPGMGTMALLPALVGHGFATEMILTARYYRGRELAGRGLFTHIKPRARVYEAALDLARSMADKPKHVLAMLKDTLSLPRRQALMAAMSREHLMHQICFAHPDTRAMIDDNYVGDGRSEPKAPRSRS